MSVNENMDFEQAVNELEKAVEALENPALKLEEHIDLYEKACELAYFCRQRLDNAKLRIDDINERLNPTDELPITEDSEE